MAVFPIIGSALSDHFGFSRAQESIALINLVVFVLYLTSTAYDWRKEKMQEIEAWNSSQEENSNLLRSE